MANAYNKLRLYDKAIATFKKALELDPNYADAHNNLGTVYKANGLWEKALEEFKQATLSNPDHALAHLNLAIVYAVKAKDKKKARYYLNRCVAINPHLPQLKMVEKELITLIK